LVDFNIANHEQKPHFVDISFGSGGDKVRQVIGATSLAPERSQILNNRFMTMTMGVVQWRSSPAITSVFFGTILYQIHTNCKVPFGCGYMQS
jgi:hypothetical protein